MTSQYFARPDQPVARHVPALLERPNVQILPSSRPVAVRDEVGRSRYVLIPSKSWGRRVSAPQDGEGNAAPGKAYRHTRLVRWHARP